MIPTTRPVTPDEAETRLDRWLRRHHPGLTQGTIEKLCRTGQIRIDGHRATPGTRLAAGQAVRIPPLPDPRAPQPRPEPSARDAEAIQRMVIHRDSALIALNKPPGLSVQGGPGITRHIDAMLDALRFGLPERPRLVHRIDRDTSGLLLLARTPGAAAKLAALFRARKVRKTYWAIVVGRPDPPAARIAIPLARIPGQHARIAAADEGTDAVTDYETLDTAGKHFAFLAMSPLTGRTHQLRVHAAELGTPILGDPKYGTETSQVEGYPRLLHLHARALTLPHPAGGELALVAPPPAHMRETMQRLGFDAASDTSSFPAG